jgi:hypothetical protein
VGGLKFKNHQKKKKKLKVPVWLRQEDLEFKASLGYIASSRPALAIQRDCSVLKIN